MSTAKASKKTFLFDAHKMSAEQFEMVGDGREAKHKSSRRRALFLELASFGNAAGKSVCPSNKTLSKRLGFSEPTVERYIADLKNLGFVRNTGKSRFQGTMIRELVLAPTPSDSQSPTSSDSSSTPSDIEPRPSDSTQMSSDSSPMPSPNDGRSAHSICPKLSAHNVPAHQPSEAVDGTMGGKEGSLDPSNSTSKPVGQERFYQPTFDRFLNCYIQWQWQKSRAEWMDQERLTEDDDPTDIPPLAIPKSGRDKLEYTFRANGFDIAKSDQRWTLCHAFSRWLSDRYYRDFDENRIKQPLSLFADDFMVYLPKEDIALEQKW